MWANLIRSFLVQMSMEDLLDHLTVGKGATDHFQYLAHSVKALLGEKKFSDPRGDGGGNHGDSGFAEILDDETTQHKRLPIRTELIVRGSERSGKVERDGGGRSTTTFHKEVIPHRTDADLKTFVLDQLDKVRVGFESNLRSEARKKDEEIAQLKMQISGLEKKVQAKETESEDRAFRLSLMENASYDGTMIWKIPQFAQRMFDAQNGKYTSIFSLPFYTSRYGYKLCLRLYILGDGIGKGTHMSLFFVVMRGEFDSILQWPFTHKVTLRLLNQNGGKDIVDGFLPDPMSTSFSRPKTDMNVASGCPRFVTHSDLHGGGFIVDDTIFIKVKVDTSGIKA